MDASFHTRVDTTYSIPEEIKYETLSLNLSCKINRVRLSENIENIILDNNNPKKYEIMLLSSLRNPF